MLSSCRKTYYANFSPLSRGGTLLVQEHPRRVCQGMRRSMLRRRRARWASSSVMPLRAISRSLARSTTSRSSRLRRGGRRAPASSPSRSSSSTAASSSRLPAGRRGGGVQGAPAPAPAGRGGQQQHRAEAGQLPGQLLRRPIRELIAAHHGGEPLLANQALDLIRGAAEQAGGRPGALQQLLESPAVFLALKGDDHRLHGALIVDDVLLPLPGGHAGAVLVPLTPLARQVVGGHVLPRVSRINWSASRARRASSREPGRLDAVGLPGGGVHSVDVLGDLRRGRHALLDAVQA